MTTSQIVDGSTSKDIHIDKVTDPPNNPTDIRQPQIFLSAERNLNTTSEDFSERWVISVVKAALTLKVTTQKLV